MSGCVEGINGGKGGAQDGPDLHGVLKGMESEENRKPNVGTKGGVAIMESVQREDAREPPAGAPKHLRLDEAMVELDLASGHRQLKPEEHESSVEPSPLSNIDYDHDDVVLPVDDDVAERDDDSLLTAHGEVQNEEMLTLSILSGDEPQRMIDPPPSPPPLASVLSDVAHFDFERHVRQPFTQSSELDADLVLARVLQEQERAYLLLTGAGIHQDRSDDEDESDGDYEDGNPFRMGEEGDENEIGPEERRGRRGLSGGEEEGNEGEEEEEGLEEFGGVGFELRLGERAQELINRIAGSMEIDGAQYDDDESFARALQDEEDRETTARMMALACFLPEAAEESEGEEDGLQDVWVQEYDPDTFSYEELMALGEAVGIESRGLPPESVASLLKSTYGIKRQKDGNLEATGSKADEEAEGDEQCVVCRSEFEVGDPLIVLPCKHLYHDECIRGWLAINKTCPMCNAEVIPPASSATSSAQSTSPTGGNTEPSPPPAPHRPPQPSHSGSKF